jgi:RNA polymerase-binding transcription factor DksA
MGIETAVAQGDAVTPKGRTNREVRIEKLKTVMEAELRDRLAKAEGFVGTGSATPNLVDAAFDATTEEVDATLDALNASSIEQIMNALSRISNGTYGRCQDCLGNIPSARLTALPFAPRCVPCQESVDAATTGRRQRATSRPITASASDDDELSPVALDAVESTRD